MKHIIFILIFAVMISLCGCGSIPEAQVVATTLPVYQFTSMLCADTPIQVSRLISESVSCLHDYTLTVPQMRLLEQAQLVVISGAGLEDFMSDILAEKTIIDSSEGIPLLDSCHTHEHSDEQDGHHHETDPHIWLDPVRAIAMAENICIGLCQAYPEHEATFQKNLSALTAQMEELDAYAQTQLQDLSVDHIITFHDGFSYLAETFDLHIAKAIEEESGSEASAAELIETIDLIRRHELNAIFTELSGSASAAQIIANETDLPIFTLDMAMSGDDYFKSMYHNIDTLKEALQ